MDGTRRNFLAIAGIAPLAVIAGSRAMAADAVCYDPGALALQQRNRRRSVGFVEESTAPGKRCGLCVFFKGGQGACGTCDLLGNGPVTARGLCNSFAAKGG
jgi:hypothetical protein